jgi:hypothetical protein
LLYNQAFPPIDNASNTPRIAANTFLFIVLLLVTIILQKFLMVFYCPDK